MLNLITLKKLALLEQTGSIFCVIMSTHRMVTYVPALVHSSNFKLFETRSCWSIIMINLEGGWLTIAQSTARFLALFRAGDRMRPTLFEK